MILQNIPAELRSLHQWVCAGEDKNPLNPRTGQPAKVNDPSTWGTFEEAASTGYQHIGFVLAKSDPYCIIDLDDPTTIKIDGVITLNPDLEEVERIATRHSKILEAFPTYAEVSQSGKGVHIVCRGEIPQGVRRQKVEIYSDLRYIICTGSILKNLAICECQQLVTMLFNEMAQDARSEVALVQVDSSLSDEEVYNMAATAANADKFLKLWRGEWVGEWPSQSEADFALLSMFTFYTPDNEQVRRLFRWSGLAREKTNRSNYHLDKALGALRAKTPPPIDFSKLKNTPYATDNEETNVARIPTGTVSGQETNTAVGNGNEVARGIDSRIETANVQREGIEFPSGFVGALADYIFASSIRPVREIALATAIALTAGVVGRAYNISGTGLNQYLIVLAKTGSGKESGAKAVSMLCSAARATMPMIDEFIGPGAFASGQALIRVLDKSPCFVSILGEFGITLQQLSSPTASSAQVMLKRVLLDIYAKSGFNDTLRSSVYSDSEKNTKTIQAPNVSLIGDSTPEDFYSNLDSASIANGLITRFSIFEYTGPRPPRNKNAFCPPPDTLLKMFTSLASVAMQAQNAKANTPVQKDEHADELFDLFDEHADRQINGSQSDVNKQLWNRAHLKALKLAALIAVGVNPHQPIITRDCAAWAMRIVSGDIEKLLSKFSEGEVGTGDVRLELDVKRAVREYLNMTYPERIAYDSPHKMAELQVVPYQYLRRKLRLLSIFKNDRRGSTIALKQTIDELVNGDVLQRMAPGQCLELGSKSPAFVCGNAWR